ncbi:large ribosomal subunit protein uL1-like [Dermacentor variabilis]|uniref:large ribosomal subunit protein uL1-like n=1 Tax=Dermacentor variabilis TaxID=34621 RepID=UPI003F5C9E36
MVAGAPSPVARHALYARASRRGGSAALASSAGLGGAAGTIMSNKVNRELLNECINKVIEESASRKRKFVETVEMQIALKNMNPHKTKPTSGAFRVKHCLKPNFKVCVIGNQKHCQGARENGVDFIDMEIVQRMKKRPSFARRIIKKYDGFLGSTTILKDVTDLVGPMMKKVGKLPLPLEDDDCLREKIHEVKTTMRFQMKRVLWLAVSVGNVKMVPEMLAENIDEAIRSLLTLLKRDWHNVKSLHIKSTMGPAQRIY